MREEMNQPATEKRNEKTTQLDTMSAFEIVSLMNEEDRLIPAAIEPHLQTIAKIAQWGAETILRGGRIFYCGAGTSGRIGVLDASECPPTFGVSCDTVIGLIAGGEEAFTKAVENAEDDREAAVDDLLAHQLGEKDLVIALAASGRTPYALSALAYASECGCHTAAITCNPGSELSALAEAGIDVDCGPEILTGSTRLKSGTAQKMILNMISTAAMVKAGRVYGNLMVDVQQT
ncbi:MAG: N-acetylmuramic acid 6-phosphate etherase, partial [Mogibacterium sp.]|nr:N-acetylmuramic acid 6-phosphate etherase [Mogibacterium sp.]